jgi:hypothetical protein
MADSKELLRAKCCQEIHQDRLRLLPNVIGTATGRQKKGKFTRDACVQVFVSRKYSLDSLPEDAIVPGELPDSHGARVSVDVIDAGFVQLLQDTTRYRPVQGGCWIGNLTRINAGTLGGWACDDADDTIVFLTNNHVVTATNNRQAIPTPSGIVQPGSWTGAPRPPSLSGTPSGSFRYRPILRRPWHR